MFVGLHDTVVHGGTVAGFVWDRASQALLARTPDVPAASQNPSGYSSTLAQPITLTAGVTYLIGWASVSGGNINPSNETADPVYDGMTMGSRNYYSGSPTTYPSTQFTTSQYRPSFSLMTSIGLTKSVNGPLDPVDFPVVSALNLIPNGGGARLQNSNNFYIRRASGQLLEFVGTPVSG